MIDLTTTPIMSALLAAVSLTLLFSFGLSFFQSAWAQTFNITLTLLALTTATAMVVSESSTQILAIFYVTLFVALMNIANTLRAVINIKRSGVKLKGSMPKV